MKRRQWDPKTTAMSVIEGLKGQSVAALCHAPQSSPAPYDPWRAQVRAQARPAVAVHEPSQRDARLSRANARWNPLVGALTLE